MHRLISSETVAETKRELLPVNLARCDRALNGGLLTRRAAAPFFTFIHGATIDRFNNQIALVYTIRWGPGERGHLLDYVEYVHARHISFTPRGCVLTIPAPGPFCCLWFQLVQAKHRKENHNSAMVRFAIFLVVEVRGKRGTWAPPIIVYSWGFISNPLRQPAGVLSPRDLNSSGAFG